MQNRIFSRNLKIISEFWSLDRFILLGGVSNSQNFCLTYLLKHRDRMKRYSEKQCETQKYLRYSYGFPRINLKRLLNFLSKYESVAILKSPVVSDSLCDNSSTE